MTNRPRAMALAALALSSSCTTRYVLRTAPPPGMRVRVEFTEPHDLVVAVRRARDSVRFDSISVVSGRVARADGDSL